MMTLIADQEYDIPFVLLDKETDNPLSISNLANIRIFAKNGDEFDFARLADVSISKANRPGRYSFTLLVRAGIVEVEIEHNRAHVWRDYFSVMEPVIPAGEEFAVDQVVLRRKERI